MRTISILFSVPQHSALFHMANNYKGRRISSRKLITVIIAHHVKTDDIVEFKDKLTLEPRDRRESFLLRPKLYRAILTKVKLSKKIPDVNSYIWQLVGQYTATHIQTIELNDYNGNKTGREVR